MRIWFSVIPFGSRLPRDLRGRRRCRLPRLLPEKLIARLRADALKPLPLGGEFSESARSRIRIAAAIGTAAYGVFLAFESTGAVLGVALERRIDFAHDVAGVVICGILLLATFMRMGDRALFATALLVQISLCVLISTAVPWAAYVRTGFIPAVTWVAPIVILFPLLVPAAPRTTALVSVLCGLAMPLAPMVLASRGWIQASGGELIASAVTAAVTVGIAIVASNTVHAALREAAAARRAGGYELVRCIARGGMGEIWEARHVMLARPAAIKLILPEKLQAPSEEREALTERFAREAKVTASLCSPHTVDLFDFGVSADGRFYFAMELLDGVNLEHFVYQYGPVSPARAVSWLAQACHSVGEAHARGLVHRDIKPGNLMICRYGREQDFVKVLDFGLARPVIPSGEGMTLEGHRMGTPGYMAPEQIYGMPADARSDVYALGCVGYWLVCGRKPFEAESAGELMKLHAESRVPCLSDLLGRAMPSRLESLLAACLDKAPDERPQTADALLAALGACLDGPPWTQAEAVAWWSEAEGAKRTAPAPPA